MVRFKTCPGTSPVVALHGPSCISLMFMLKSSFVLILHLLTTAAQLEVKYLSRCNFCCSLFLFSDDDMEASASSDSDDASKDNTVCITCHILRMN